MPKKVVNDIVIKTKRPVHHKAPTVVVAEEPKESPRPETFESKTQPAPQSQSRSSAPLRDLSFYKKQTNYPAFIPSHNANSSRIALWALAVVSVISLVFALSSLFSGASVTITPSTQAFSLKDTSMAAEIDNPESELSFQTMTLSESEIKNINSTTKETVDKKASGTVVIYNDYSAEPQRLVIDTRLEDPTGKIYRIDKSVTVPGRTVKGGASVPGSVEVTVHADKPGEEYNIDLTDFTIPGFKGSPRYDKFYARSKTPISGAIKGEVYILNPADSEKVRAELTAALKDKLMKKAHAELPAGYVLFEDNIYFESTNNEVVFESKDQAVPVKVEGRVLALILDEKKLTEKIASLSIKDYDKTVPVYIPKIGELSLDLVNDPATLATAKEITFHLSGAGVIVWSVDEDKLQADLAGKSKKSLTDVLANYPNIARAEAKISPFWRSKFPGQKKDIKIINTEVSK